MRAYSVFGKLHVSEPHDGGLDVQIQFNLIGDVHGAVDVHTAAASRAWVN